MRTPEQIEAMVPISDRSAQRFPRLRETQLEVVKRFANVEARRFAPGDKIYEVGDRGVPSWFLLEGSAESFGRDGLDQEIAVRQNGQGTAAASCINWARGRLSRVRAPVWTDASRCRSMRPACARSSWVPRSSAS